MKSNLIAQRAKEAREHELKLQKESKEKAELLRKIEEKKREVQLANIRRRENIEEERRIVEEERIEALKVHKTKEYYERNFKGDKVPPKGEPLYFGENINKYGAWCPHGFGEMYVNGILKYEGNFRNGELHGNAVFNFSDGSAWEGEFKEGKIHGVGFIKNSKDGSMVEALARNNAILCLKSELKNGKQIEFNDSSLKIVSVYGKPRGTIMYHIRNWLYRVKMQDQMTPPERDVDFSSIQNFQILHNLPQIYDLIKFGIKANSSSRYNYYTDTYGNLSDKPRLGVALSRKTETMKFYHPEPLQARNRCRSDYSENIFESTAYGICSASQEEQDELNKVSRRQQWEKLIEVRRAEEEADRSNLIELEQQRMLEESISLQRDKLKQHKEEEDSFHKEFTIAISNVK